MEETMTDNDQIDISTVEEWLRNLENLEVN